MKDDTIATNPNDLSWPLDTAGFTSTLRREILKAVDRTRGEPNKITVLFDTLVLGAKFTRVRAEVLQQAYSHDAPIEQTEPVQADAVVVEPVTIPPLIAEDAVVTLESKPDETNA